MEFTINLIVGNLGKLIKHEENNGLTMSIYNWLYKSKDCSVHQDLFENTCNNVLSILCKHADGKSCSIVNKIQISNSIPRKMSKI